MNDFYDPFFDFTIDTSGYWDNFWVNRNGLGQSSADPDKYSPTLKEFHKRAWRRALPNGQLFELENDPKGYLRWNGMRFASDSITASFRYELDLDIRLCFGIRFFREIVIYEINCPMRLASTLQKLDNNP